MSVSTFKKRNWAFIVYPESAPEDWKEQLKLKGLMTAISPLHDRDINPTGEVKKPHYHVIVCYNGPVRLSNVDELSKSINGTLPIPLESVVGMYRYLTHKDNPEKAQYNEEDIILYNGFDPVVLLTETEMFSLLKQGLELIVENRIYQFEDFEWFLLQNDLSDIFNVSVKYCYFFQQVLASRRCKMSIAKNTK